VFDAATRDMDDYAKPSSTDKSHGMVVGVAGQKKKFVPQKFWANKSICRRFPLHAHVAKCYYPAILHEATSERSFSDCGHQLDDRRRNMDKNVVCAQVRLVTGERIEEISPDIIIPFYQSRKRKRPSTNGLADLWR
jgi:hypothetical protein